MITERTRPYETLIRHNADGTIGAHHLQINEVMRDGEIIAAQIGQAQPLAGPDVEAVVGLALPQALEQVAALQAALNAETQRTQGLATQVAELQAALEAGAVSAG